jgi:PhzF family phenazine biosynthesis protein
MPSVPIYVVDAFTDRVFAGNPAAVCPLDAWVPDVVMQAMAQEHNLSETVFFVPRVGEPAAWDIRWFTPTTEIDLADHPTLAAAFIIFERLQPALSSIRFHGRAGGVLNVGRDGDQLAMDFPARPPTSRPDLLASLAHALRANPREALTARDAMAVFASEADVRALAPDMAAVAALDQFGVIATAPGDDCDFVSRFFAPAAGVPEDPVTGSAHCTLVPFWAERLGRDKLFARQVSRRGGALWCAARGDRVAIAGRAALYLEGTAHLP